MKLNVHETTGHKVSRTMSYRATILSLIMNILIVTKFFVLHATLDII